ncbi:MAG: hypothetical protein M1837_002838 [Sclerophora amabilis]|nr:MAG: hypothetical protein M1837_002838 [Sclerophora amabilis]
MPPSTDESRAESPMSVASDQDRPAEAIDQKFAEIMALLGQLHGCFASVRIFESVVMTVLEIPNLDFNGREDFKKLADERFVHGVELATMGLSVFSSLEIAANQLMTQLQDIGLGDRVKAIRETIKRRVEAMTRIKYREYVALKLAFELVEEEYERWGKMI